MATVLDEIAQGVAAAARGLADGWPDARGREWAERLLLVHHALGRDADAAAELGRAIDRVAAATPASVDDPSGAPSGGYGPSLGSTSARRVHDRPGVTIPRLNDAAGTEG